MQPLEKLLRKLKREGKSLPSWMMPLGHEVITYDGVRYAHRAAIEKLRKDAGDDDDDEGDEDEDENEENESEDGEEGESANEDDDTSDFNAKHPRWPAGSPDGTGGEFAPKDGGGAAVAAPATTDAGSIPADQIKTPVTAPADKPATANNTATAPSTTQTPSATLSPAYPTGSDMIGDKNNEEDRISSDFVLPAIIGAGAAALMGTEAVATAVTAAGRTIANVLADTSGAAGGSETVAAEGAEASTATAASGAATSSGAATGEAVNAEMAESLSVDPAQTMQNLKDLLMPGGQRVGQAGNSVQVRIIQGGIDDAQAMFNQLTQGGKVVADTNYKGTFFELPNGTTIGIRTSATRSPDTVATLDINKLPSNILKIREVKFNP